MGSSSWFARDAFLFLYDCVKEKRESFHMWSVAHKKWIIHCFFPAWINPGQGGEAFRHKVHLHTLSHLRGKFSKDLRMQ